MSYYRFHLIAEGFKEFIQEKNLVAIAEGTAFRYFNGDKEMVFHYGNVYPYFDLAATDFGNIQEEILSNDLFGLIVKVTCIEAFEKVNRERGVYELNFASGEIEHEIRAGKQQMVLTLQGPTWQTVKALRNRILAGTIRPTESWDGPQTGISFAEIGAELERVSAELTEKKLEIDARELREQELYNQLGSANQRGDQLESELAKAKTTITEMKALWAEIITEVEKFRKDPGFGPIKLFSLAKKLIDFVDRAAKVKDGIADEMKK